MSVARPRGSGTAEVVLGGVEGREGDSGGGVGAGRDRRQGDYPRGGRLLEGGKEEFDEQRVRDVVDTEVFLVAFGGEARGYGHDSGVEDHGGESACLGEQGPAGGLDGAEGGLAARDEGDADMRGDVVHVRDYALGGGGGAAGEEDVRGVVRSEGEDCAFPETGSSCWDRGQYGLEGSVKGEDEPPVIR